jgi:hypothetical protein
MIVDLKEFETGLYSAAHMLQTEINAMACTKAARKINCNQVVIFAPLSSPRHRRETGILCRSEQELYDMIIQGDKYGVTLFQI